MAITEQEAACQVLSVFADHKIPPTGFLRRNQFSYLRDDHFTWGMRGAMERHWVKRHERDRYRYILTEGGRTAIATVLNATT